LKIKETDSVMTEEEKEPEAETEEVAEETETLEDWQDRALRAQADMQNMRKRLDSDVEERTRARTEALLSEVVMILDHFELALEAMPAELEKDKNAGPFAQGVRAIHMSLGMLLTRFGVQAVDPEPEDKFDPAIHEAIQTIEKEGLESPQIQKVRTGYKMGNRILRPAQVNILNPITPDEDSA
jgi:molecular chaperone GrpE